MIATMGSYRVKVEAHVVVDAKSNTDARAKAELAVRQAVADSYRQGGSPYWSDDWQAFGFRARGSERYEDGNDGD